MISVLHDLRHSLRAFVRRPGFALLVVVTLGLGIGATTVIYSVTSAVLLRQLSFPDPDRLVTVFETQLPKFTYFSVAPANFLDWQAQNRVFTDMAALEEATVSLSGAGEPARLIGRRVSSSFFRILQVNPLIGRTLVPEDDRPGAELVAVLSHGLWQDYFGADSTVLGRAITLDAKAYTVVGVMPQRARFLTSPWDPQDVEIWLANPFAMDPREERAAKRLTTIARLAPGVTVERARVEMEAVAGRLQRAYPETNKGWSVGVRLLRDDLTQFARSQLLVLLGGAFLLLLIACVNVANLLLVHTTGRQRELAVRASMGASRARIGRQLLTETAVLAMLGGGLGSAIAHWTLPVLLAIAPSNIPRLDEAVIDARVLGFAFGISLLVTMAAGLVPAVRGMSGDLMSMLKEGGDRTTSGRRHQRGRLVLVATQVALALILLDGAGLMVSTLLHLNRVDLGFDPTNVVEVQVALPRTLYATAAGTGTQRGTDTSAGTERFTRWVVRPEQPAFVEAVLDRFRALPGVQSAAAINYPPATGQNWGYGFKIEGAPPLEPGVGPSAMVKYPTPGYFRMMRVPILRGRAFTDADRNGAQNVAIINDALARKYLSGADPLATRLRIQDGLADNERSFQVVGVVGTEKQAGLDAEPEPLLYIPYRQQASAYIDWQVGFRMRVSFLARTRDGSLAIANDLRQAVWAVDPNQPIARMKSMDAHIAASLAARRLYAIVLGAFSILGAGLAALGIYGVMSYTVNQRTHEIGLRMALGARAGNVLRLVLADAITAATTGVLVGLAATVWLTRLIKSQLYGVQPTDPGVLIVMTLAMVLIAAVTALVPAWRATRVNPMVTLRSE